MRNSFESPGLTCSRKEDGISGIKFDEHLIRPRNQIPSKGLVISHPALRLVEDDMVLSVPFLISFRASNREMGRA
jgi:hypothetical protein